MSKDKISSQEMVEQIATKLSVSKRVAEEFLKSLFAEIEDTLIKGESVKIKNLGTFKMQWNEPRKSVNVQTGEVIIIDGYNKVTFTPDSELKEAVNEPYSHLEPVELDGQEIPSFEIEKPVIQTPETLRNITEQASEIKDILSEIQSLSQKKETTKASESHVELPDYELILIDEEVENQTSEPEVQITATSEMTDVSTPVQEAEVTEEIIVTQAYEPPPSSLIEEKEEETEIAEPLYYGSKAKSANSSQESESEPFILGNKKKRKGLKFLIWFIVLTAIIGTSIYVTYFSSSCVRCWFKYDVLSETNRMKMNEYKNSFTGWFTSDKKEKASSKDSVQKPETNLTLPENSTEPAPTVDSSPSTAVPTDSLQQLFDSHREYTEFIGEEEITEGIRLTTIAQRYYGKKDFWVYIYEANRDNIVHPDRITPGTIVKIPKVDKRLIDKKNPRCIQKARELHDLYVGKK